MLTKNFNRYKNIKIEKLRTLKSKDPKEYWRLLNTCTSTKAKDNPVPIEDFYNFFERINNSVASESETVTNQNDINPINEEINLPITPYEIVQAVNSLKNNKSTGIDEILNEHIKASLHFNAPNICKII